jgi:hypothetical protein
MPFPMFVARWDTYLGLSPPDDFVREFLDVRMEVMYCSGVLFFQPSEDGTPLHLKRNDDIDRGERALWAYEWKRTAVVGGLDGMPRFALHETTMHMDDDGCLTWSMPSDHELPWPHVKSTPSRMRRAMALRDLPQRVLTARLCGLDMERFVQGVPDWVKSALHADEWRRIIMEEPTDAQ